MITKNKVFAAVCSSGLALALVGVGATSAAAATDPIAGWTLRQMVGATFMVGAPAEGISEETIALLKERHAGGIFLHGRSTEGVEAVANQVAAYRDAKTIPSKLLVSTDQEGGNVQVLKGPGFSVIPSGAAQSHTTTIGLESETWGLELRAAGINVNLAPVMDLIDPHRDARSNEPIGYWDRQYGRNSATIQAKAGAFARGMQRADIIPVIKHFPGIGRVRDNPDLHANVTDWVTTPDDVAVRTFTQAADRLSNHNPQPWVMMSTVIYNKIDPGTPAAFSPEIVKLVRDSGFNGVITTDDLSQAEQVQAWTPEQRAIRSIEAGVDMVLFSAKIDDVPAAMDAVFRRAQTVPAFRARVEEAARRVATAAAALPVD